MSTESNDEGGLWSHSQKKLAEQGAATGFQLAWGTVKSLGKRLWTEAKVAEAMAQYANKYIERNGRVKVLGMPKSIPLRDIYTTVKLIPPSYRNRYADIDGLKSMYTDYSTPHPASSRARPGMELANDEQYLNVLGPPGAGKTTFLKRIGLEALLPRRKWIELPSFANFPALTPSAFEHTCLPVFIELRRLKSGPIDLWRLIQEEFEICGFPNSDHFIQGALNQGRLLVLLDGLDEVPSKSIDSTIVHIQDFVDLYSQNRFITSCRTAFYRTPFRKFSDAELTPFEDTQINNFVFSWFNSSRDEPADIAEDFLAELYRSKHQPTLELARTPLLLTFLCLVYDDTQKFPKNRAKLYRDALLILLEKWAAEKRVHYDTVYKDLHTELEIELLSEIAASAYIRGDIFFSEEQLIDDIGSFMMATLDAPKTLEGRRILRAIEVQQGLIVQRAADIFSFSHLTIQEYLTANYFNSASRMKTLCDEYFFDRRWREVFLLLSGITRTDELLEMLIERLIKYERKNRRLARYIEWASRATRHSGNPEIDAARRTYVLSLALRFKLSGHQGAIAFFEKPANELLRVLQPGLTHRPRMPDTVTVTHIMPCLRELKRLKFIKGELSKAENTASKILRDKPAFAGTAERGKFNRRILDILYDALDLPKDLRSLGGTRSLIADYLVACKLIVECKDSASRVSRHVWRTACGTIVSSS